MSIALDSWIDFAQALLLPAMFDSSSPLSGLPKDVLRNILRYFVPTPDGPYLLHKPIARSYHQICSLVHRKEDFRPEKYELSITAFDPRFQSGLKLVPAAEQVLRFFLRQKEAGLELRNCSKERLDEHLNDYADFMFHRFGNLTPHACPSLEVQSIWLSHMLQSLSYMLFTRWLKSRYAQKISAFDESKMSCHCIVENCAPSQEDASHPTPSVPNSFVLDKGKTLSCEEARPIILHFMMSPFAFNTTVIREDQCWIDEFLRFNEGSKVLSQEFLSRAHLGYQRMMYLKWKRTEEMEQLGFSPCPSIDLIWHTHLLFPALYAKDMLALLGHVPGHKLLAVDKRTLHTLNCRDDADERLWMKEFQESLFTYSTH